MDATPLFELIARLRHPETGCPWDRKQRFVDLVQPLLNEAQELREAVEAGDRAHIREELGDVLFNVCALLRAAEEEGLFEPEAAMQGVIDKMTGRHPHVFGDARAATEQEAQALYLAAKRLEKNRNEPA